jgi:hypothetical protein
VASTRRFHSGVIVAQQLAALVVSVIGWLAALGWIIHLLIKRLL